MSFAAENLTCLRADQLIFESVSFSLSPGDALWVRGRNGAGKSSLLRICAQLLKPLSGMLKWEGEDIRVDSSNFHGSYHYLGHQDALKSVLTVSENLSFWAGFHGTPDVARALAEFELDALRDTPAGMLSQGQKKRTNLARLAASDARLWILDEPVSALDQHFIDLFKDHLIRHLQNGGMALFATHQDLMLANAQTLNLDDIAP